MEFTPTPETQALLDAQPDGHATAAQIADAEGTSESPVLELEPTDTETCVSCNEVHDADTSTEYLSSYRHRAPSGQYCEDCANSYLAMCHACEDTVHVDDARESNAGRLYCPSCYSERYATCERCECEVHVDNTYYTQNDDGPYCSDCYTDEEESNDGPVFDAEEDVLRHCSMLGNPKDGLRFGIELEIEAGSYYASAADALSSHMEGYAILKADGSLNHGFEIVTAPAPLADHVRELDARLFQRSTVSKYHLESFYTDTCGMHVHMSRAALTELQIGKMLVFLHNRDNARFVQCIAQRDPSDWAEIHSSKKHGDAKRTNDRRYTALNLQNSRTVELRIFKGNLKRERVLKNLEFCEALVRWCAAGTCSVNECAQYGLFVEYVAKRRKDWPNLHAFLVERRHITVKPSPRGEDKPIQGEV